MQNLHLLVADGVRREGAWRLHGGESEQLQEVILEHVPKNSRLLIVLSAPFHTDCFGGGDLHVGDVVSIPQWLEDLVPEAEYQDILVAFLPKVVIDTIDLVLAEFVEYQP